MSDETFRFRVERIVPETPLVKTFRLRPEGPGMPFRFSPGQHMGVRPLPSGAHDAEEEAWRHFSLCSCPVEDFVEITVLKQGAVSDRIHALRPGDWVETTQPAGSFVLEERVRHGPVFFAGGIGIAPIRSMVRFCLARGLEKAIGLFASFPEPAHTIFSEEIRAWSEEVPNFSVWLTYTGPAQRPKARVGDAHPWDRAYLEERIERPLERVYYLCAPRGLMDIVEKHLSAIGVPADRIRRERWT